MNSPTPTTPNLASLLLQELEKLHGQDGGWVFIRELRCGTGYGPSSEQRLDAWAIHCYRTHGPAPSLRRAFEIKTSREDVTRELRHADKRWKAYALSHEFYFVVPAGLVPVKLLTRDDGLIEWDGSKLAITRRPRVRESMPPRWDFVAQLARTLNR